MLLASFFLLSLVLFFQPPGTGQTCVDRRPPAKTGRTGKGLRLTRHVLGSSLSSSRLADARLVSSLFPIVCEWWA